MIHTENVDLLSNANATGQDWLIKLGGTYNLSIVGTFGGATAQLQFLGPDGATYISVPGAGFNSANAVTVLVASGTVVRMSVSGGTPSGLFAKLSRSGGQG